MKIPRMFYKKCTTCGIGRMVKGICDKCGDAYYEQCRPQLPFPIKLIPRILIVCYSRIKWKIKLRGAK